MEDLSGEDIELLLAALGDELAKKFTEPVQVLMIGGAYMVIMLHNRETTKDIDVFPLNLPDLNAKTKETKQVQSAVRAVAKQHGTSREWFNDVVFSILGDIHRYAQMELWRTFGVLEVYIPSRDFVLALKLFADREKDHDDIKSLSHHLGIATRPQAQAILDRYIDRFTQQEYRVHLTLARWFP